jgi:hypothetical protein
MKAAQIIRERIQAMPAGYVFTPANFAGVGTRASIDQALMRLMQAGSIERVGHGLYVSPKITRFGLKTMPSPESVAKAIATMEGATIEVHGAEAARRFGLTTQVPAQPVFYTTGSSRSIRMGNLIIHFQHVAARKLAIAGRPAGQALVALWYLGKGVVTSQTFERIRSKLSYEEFEVLKQAKFSMPAWMLEEFRNFEKKEFAHA